MNLIFTEHLKLRLKLRKIPEKYPKIIFENSEQHFFDVSEKRDIKIKRLKYNQKLRNMMIVYESKNDYIEIITIHPISDDQIINRIKTGRWLEK